MNDFTPVVTEVTEDATAKVSREWDVLNTEIETLNNKVQFLETELAIQKDRVEHRTEQLRSIHTKIDSLKEYLIDNYDSLEMHADEIAEMFDIDLSREVTYTVSLSATVTVSVKPGEDAESLITDNLYVESNHGDISVDDYEIDYTNEA